MTTQTLRLKTPILTLPDNWRDQEVFIRKSKDIIIVKKMEAPAFWNTWKKMKSFSKDFSQKDIEKIVKKVRKSFG